MLHPLQLSVANDMTDEEFRLFKQLVYDECGINFKPEKKAFLQNRTIQRMKATDVKSYYRYKPQLDLFQYSILPEIISKKRMKNDFTLKIWSAGCSTGQEPYTIAIILNELMTDIKGWKVSILASDLSMTALEAAQQGAYPREKMEGVEASHLKKYFTEKGEHFHAKDELKRLVIFDFHNLF